MNGTKLGRRVVRNRLMRAAIRSRLPVVERLDLVRLGSAACGWWVPEGLITRGGIAYCAGVGEDITFDLALIQQCRCAVWAFDPTPSVVDAVRSWVVPPEWHFEPVGVWNRDDVIRLYLPEDPNHVSLSATNVQGTDEFVEAPVESLDTLMRRFGHDRIDLLKLDIEGAEGPVLRAMIASGLFPTVLCVEFDQPEAPWFVARRVRELLDVGYALHNVEHWNYTFSRATSSASP